jgi:hypothetical protein
MHPLILAHALLWSSAVAPTAGFAQYLPLLQKTDCMQVCLLQEPACTAEHFASPPFG